MNIYSIIQVIYYFNHQCVSALGSEKYICETHGVTDAKEWAKEQVRLMNDVLSRLVFTKVLFPPSQKSSFEDSKRFIGQPSFELHGVYRALSALAGESDSIQSRLSQKSSGLSERKTDIISYDCKGHLKERALDLGETQAFYFRNIL